MSAVLTRPRSIASSDSKHPAPVVPAQQPVIAIGKLPSSAGFAALLGAYRSSGGTARGDDLARLLADHHRGDYVSLARLIAAEDVFGFEWRQTLWIPMFQFDPRDLGVKAALRQVLAELAPDFDSWALAAWFANGNSWLDGRRPVDMLERDPAHVMDAARADRFIAAA